MTRETQLAQQLTLAVDAFIDYINSLPENQLCISKRAKWGPREVLIHLVFWHEQYAQIAEAAIHRKTPILLRGSFKSWNAKAVQLEQGTTVKELLRRFKTAQHRLVAISRKKEATTLSFSFREGSKSWPYDDALVAISGHIQRHIARPKKQGSEV